MLPTLSVPLSGAAMLAGRNAFVRHDMLREKRRLHLRVEHPPDMR
ncbi:hypothetical protein [Burkholderia sp. lig30]|jgi:hypothetical protein|nr:hypothetical protein [Burkholderia sp. lig30]